MKYGTLGVGVGLLLISLGSALPEMSAAEPIIVPDAFAAADKPLPKSWRGRDLKVTIESVPIDAKGTPQLRVAKSSGDKRADRTAVAYASFLLNAKPELRAMNATNMLTFPIVIEGGAKGGKPRKAMRKHASLNKPKGGFKDPTARKFEPIKTP